MKKYLVIFAAAFLVIALTSPSYAQFKTYGHLEVLTIWQKNATWFNDDKSDNRRHMAERFRFYLEYGDPKTVRAVLGFEADASQFGEPSQATVTTTLPAGSAMAVGPSTASRNKIGALNADQAGLEIKHAYMDVVIPNTPVTLTTGIFGVSVGGHLGRYFLLSDVPGVRLRGAFAPHTIEALWYKQFKESAYTDNDTDMYLLRYLLSQKQFRVEAWLAYELDRRTAAESWSFVSGPTMTPVTPAGSTDYVLRKTMTARTFDAKRWWIGAHVPITVENFTITPTFIYQFGQARDYWTTGTNVDINAWLANLEVMYRLGPGLAFTLQGYYSTGGDTGKKDELNLYSTPNGSESINVFGNGWSVFYFQNTELTYYGHKREAFGGFWLGRLTATYSPTKWLELQGSYIYIGDTSKGTAGSQAATGATNNTVGARTDKKNEDYVGSELNLIATIKIYDNIRYKIGFGYFMPGDVYDKLTTATKTDNAWNFLTNLNFVF